MKQTTVTDIWDAIEDNPQEAVNMRLRSELMLALHRSIEKQKMSQAEAARYLGVSQPRISDLLRGKIHLFALDTLVKMASAAGMNVRLQIVPAREPKQAKLRKLSA